MYGRSMSGYCHSSFCYGVGEMTMRHGDIQPVAGKPIYLSNSDCVWVINHPLLRGNSAAEYGVVLNITHLDLEPDYDFLTISRPVAGADPMVAGPDQKRELLRLTGTSAPSDPQVYIGGPIILEFTSDRDKSATGFTVSYSVMKKTELLDDGSRSETNPENPAPELTPAPKKNPGLLVGLAIGAAVIVAAGVTAMLFFMRRSRRTAGHSFSSGGPANMANVNPVRGQEQL
jgi:hypothetical protein